MLPNLLLHINKHIFALHSGEQQNVLYTWLYVTQLFRQDFFLTLDATQFIMTDEGLQLQVYANVRTQALVENFVDESSGEKRTVKSSLNHINKGAVTFTDS